LSPVRASVPSLWSWCCESVTAGRSVDDATKRAILRDVSGGGERRRRRHGGARWRRRALTGLQEIAPLLSSAAMGCGDESADAVADRLIVVPAVHGVDDEAGVRER